MKFRPYILTIGFILASLYSFPGDYSVISIGAKGEFKDNYVHCIYKDTDGFIWLGTGTTVERWDGIQSVAYSFPENNLEYAPYLVNSIVERTPHDYWIGCKEGLWRLNLTNHKLERVFLQQINFPVSVLAADGKGVLYIGTENGLYIYNGTTLRNVRMNSKNTLSGSNHVVGIEITGDNTVWLMTPEGLVWCEPETGTTKYYPNSLSECGKLISLSEIDQTFYIGTEKRGIIAFDRSGSTYSLYWDKIQAPVTALSYEDGLLAVATLGQGVQLLSVRDKRMLYMGTYNTGDGVISNKFSSILLSKGNIWCGTDYYAGMIYLRKKQTPFSLYSTQGFNSEGVPVRGSFLSGHQLFISNRNGIVAIQKDKNEVRYFNTKNVDKDKLRSDLIFSFYEYEGILLLGTYAGGVSAMIPETYTFVETPLTKALTKNDIFMFLEDEAHNLWVAASDGLYFYNKQTRLIREFNAFNSGMPGNIVYGIFIDSSGRFWVATNRGITLFDRKTETCSQALLPEEGAIKYEPVRSIYEGRDGTLFFCLLNKEKTIFASDPDFKNFQYPLPLECLNIIQDTKGCYWLGTALGILKMNEDLSSFTLFSSADGLPDAPMSSGPPIIEDESGHFWISNTKGLVMIDPDKAVAPSVLKITEVFVNGEQILDNYSLQSGNVVSLKRSQNNLVFRFVSLDYGDPEKMKYEFLLEGLDSTWSRLDHENKVAYYNLKSDTYTFKVRKLLNKESMAEISFQIEKGFPWRTSLVIVLLFVGAGFVVLLIRNKKKQASRMASGGNSVVQGEGKKEDTIAFPESYVKLTKDEEERMINELKTYMTKEKPYLNVDLKQSDIAATLGYSTYLLSALFTHYLKTGYYDFVNTYRIEEFKNRVKAGEHKKYTLLTLAERCGFKSKTSFFRSFKKVTGLTPREYIQQAK